MKQVIVIHGGNAFDTYDEYLDDLKKKELTLERLKSNDWKSSLADTLGSEFDVLTPRMPNAQNAKYLEWKIWFEKLIPLLDEIVVFVGHSLGGIFLAKYLSENIYPKKIRATLLVAAPYNTPTHHPLADFTLTTSFQQLAEQGGEIILFHSSDDVVVEFENLEKYHMALPQAKTCIFQDKGHFNQEEFPELVSIIKEIV